VKCVSVTIVGAGRLGAALALRLASAGYNISEIITRGNRQSLSDAKQLARKVETQVLTFQEAELTAGLVWFCVPDAEISKAATALLSHKWKGKIVVHSSGVLTSDVLSPLRQKGGHIASAHPLMTFVRSTLPELEGVPFAIEGDPIALRAVRRVIHDLGGNSIPVRKQDKIAYHTFATMICPLLVSLLAAAEQTAALAGMSAADARRRIMPILRQTLANYGKCGPSGAFSGPIVRGDTETVRAHLRALDQIPDAKRAYVALAQAALGYLPSRNTEKLRKLLREATPGGTRRNGLRTSQANTRSARRSQKSQ
jgi:predicted short-subunit dehydrogenase-like oxidoreductase (DUF2520 family)